VARGDPARERSDGRSSERSNELSGEVEADRAHGLARGRGRAWTLLLAVAARRRAGTLPHGPAAVRLRDDGTLEQLDRRDARAELSRREDGTFAVGPGLDDGQRDFVELYLPMLGRRDDESSVVAHLGQSVDGCIATASGHSAAVTGTADFVHMHRLRALADAVLVGAGTVEADDPRLTTRLVDGPSPVRVVIDPRARLAESFGVFTDGAAPTLRVRAAGNAKGVRAGGGAEDGRDAGNDDDGKRPDTADTPEVGTIAVEADPDGGVSLPELLRALRGRGIRIVFIEGGGVTVTRWLHAGLLDRLHLVVAPVLIGGGRPALDLPPIATMAESLRPRCRLHLLGQDVLWDFDLRDVADDDATTGDTCRRLS